MNSQIRDTELSLMPGGNKDQEILHILQKINKDLPRTHSPNHKTLL